MSAEDAQGEERPRKPLSPAARAAIARYRRTLGNVACPEEGEASPSRERSDLERHLVDRPPHWAPPHRDRPTPRRAADSGQPRAADEAEDRASAPGDDTDPD